MAAASCLTGWGSEAIARGAAAMAATSRRGCGAVRTGAWATSEDSVERLLRSTVTCLTSTAPAVTIAAAASPAAAFEATAPRPTCSAPAAAAPPPAAAPVPAAVAPPPAAAVVPSWAKKAFLSSSTGPIGSSAAKALFVWRNCLRNAVQRSH